MPYHLQFSSVESFSHARLFVTHEPQPPSLHVHHQLLESTHIHVHWVGDTIQPSHLLSSPSPPALNHGTSGSFQMSQLFTLGGQSIWVSASIWVLPMNTQDWSPLGWTGWISLQSKGHSESSPTPQFKNINSSALSFICSPTVTSIHNYWKKPLPWQDRPLLAKKCLCFLICCLGWS